MPTIQDLKSELKEILNVCTERASLPATLPHCAICARYATDNLPFEALLSLIDVMPAEILPGALAAATDRLSGLPLAMRQQLVDAVTLPVLMDSPGWPLVRSLVIDMVQQEVHKHFDDPRLQAIEEVTLLGFAYDGCELKAAFNQALFHARGFASLRSLTFHSIEGDAELSRHFWASPLARQLERIDGVPYFGEVVSGPLAVRELSLSTYIHRQDLSISPLLDPGITPHLRNLSIGGYDEGLEALLRLLADERELFERIEHVTLMFSDYGGERIPLIRSATLPTTARSVTLRPDLSHVSTINISGGCDLQTLYDSANEKVDIRCGDQVTDYSSLVFDWRFRDQISRRISDLSLLLPLEVDLAEVVAYCSELPQLRKLSLIYPFAEHELEWLLSSEKIRGLEGLTLSLSVHGGQWDRSSKNEYMKANHSRYQSSIPAKWLFTLAFGETTASIHNLSIATRSFDLTRSPVRIQHCEIQTEEAAFALAECNPDRPIEVLTFDYDVQIGERLATALVGADLLERTYRLNIRGRVDEPAARILASCGKLKSVRAFSHFCYHNSIESVGAILGSHQLTGAWDVGLSLPHSQKAPGIESLCANSPLLDRAVALSLDLRDSCLIPHSGRLGRVRRLAETLNINVFGDARLAAVWADCPLGRPLRAQLRYFVERTYRVEHRAEDLPELEAKLLSFQSYDDEIEFEKTLRALLTTAFAGKPAAETAAFTTLTSRQQSALKAIAAVKDNWWIIGLLMQRLMKSYGFPFWNKEALEKYIAGTDQAKE